MPQEVAKHWSRPTPVLELVETARAPMEWSPAVTAPSSRIRHKEAIAIPKNTEYDFEGEMRIVMFCSLPTDPAQEVPTTAQRRTRNAFFELS